MSQVFEDIAKISNTLKKHLADEYLIRINEEVDENTDLFQSGMIDSYGYMRLLNYMEAEFNFKMTEEELFAHVLSSFNSMIDFIKKKLGLNQE